jgi:hypothetical protein
MSLKTLAEAIILQSAEDILDERYHAESVEFLSGKGFRVCAEMAGMDHSAQCKFLNLARARLAESMSGRNTRRPFIRATLSSISSEIDNKER